MLFRSLIPFLLLLILPLSACAPGPTKEVPKEFKSGQDYFHKVCSNCHGSDALGGKTKAPNLIKRKYLPPDFTDEDIRDTVLNGSQSGKMPAQTAFNNQEIEEVIKYLRHSQLAAGLKPEIEDPDDEEEDEDEPEETRAQKQPTSPSSES